MAIPAVFRLALHENLRTLNAVFLNAKGIEDIVAVLDGRPVIVDEVGQSVAALRSELRKRFRDLLSNQGFVDSVSGHMPTDAASQARVPIVIDRMRQISEFE